MTSRSRNSSESLFDRQSRVEAERNAPLAERMRPKSFEEFVGQEQVVGRDRVLFRSIAAGRIPSFILWGPPGAGKTTLARLVATATEAAFEPVSAVTSGVADLRRIVGEARERRGNERAGHNSLCRRDPPLQQGPAGRHPAPRRERDGYADRRHHREPVLRGDCPPALTQPSLRPPEPVP